jgi:hypothetical protein
MVNLSWVKRLPTLSNGLSKALKTDLSVRDFFLFPFFVSVFILISTRDFRQNFSSFLFEKDVVG